MVAILGLGLVAAWAIGSATPPEASRRDDAVNLALRRTAHHLLRRVGDSTSRIPAVEHPNAATYRLQLARAFDYDSLPRLLEESLKRHQIQGSYEVTVLDCATGILQLGYITTDLAGDEPVPCGGRDPLAGCVTLQVTFAQPPPAPQRAGLWWALAVGGLLAGLLYTVWPRAVPPAPMAPPSEPAPVVALAVGKARFDLSNQTLTVGNTRHDLTYREAKLLRQFAEHPNEVLTREAILRAVWEDEGVTVGRSVDVFVSRLRKLLQPDETVRLGAVHGVGYRLTVLPEGGA